MKETKEPLGSRIGKGFLETILVVFSEFLLWPIFIGYFLACFWLFDRFHVSNPDTQLAFALAPFVLGGLWLAFYLSRRSWRGR